MRHSVHPPGAQCAVEDWLERPHSAIWFFGSPFEATLSLRTSVRPVKLPSWASVPKLNQILQIFLARPIFVPQGATKLGVLFQGSLDLLEPPDRPLQTGSWCCQ